MRGGSLAAGVVSAAMLAGCLDAAGRGPPVPELPLFFALNAAAAAESDAYDADCSLEFVVEISGEVSRTNRVVEYIATMGGEAVRNLQRDDGSGVVLSAFAFYPQLQVLHILPDR